jgi:histidinol-phosphate aminotransferase
MSRSTLQLRNGCQYAWDVHITHAVQVAGIVSDDIIDICRLYPDPYCRNLRDKLSAINSVPVQEVLVDAGADSLIFLSLRVRVNVGDAVVTTAGTYPTFKYFAEGVGAQIVEVPYKEEREGLSVDLEALCAAAKKHSAALVYIANPDNPTGHVHSAESIESLRRSLPESTTLIVDEAYIDFSPSHSLRLVPRSDAWRNTIQLRTLSKAYGLAGAPPLPTAPAQLLTEGERAGLRVGYAIADPQWIDKADQIRVHFATNNLSNHLVEKVV